MWLAQPWRRAQSGGDEGFFPLYIGQPKMQYKKCKSYLRPTDRLRSPKGGGEDRAPILPVNGGNRELHPYQHTGAESSICWENAELSDQTDAKVTAKVSGVRA